MLNPCSKFILELVAQEGLNPARPLNDNEFDTIFKKTSEMLEESEKAIAKQESSLKHLYSFERFAA